MKKLISIALVWTAMFVNAGPAMSQNITAGKKLAQTWCGSCHAVEPDTKGRVFDVAPSFTSIGNMPSTTSISLEVYLSTPHTNMPNNILTGQEIRDVAAYILSLRQPQKEISGPQN